MDDKVKASPGDAKAGCRAAIQRSAMRSCIMCPNPSFRRAFATVFAKQASGDCKRSPAAPSFPETVPGVEAGKPIVADDMLAAVSAIPDNLRKTGYPLAKGGKNRLYAGQARSSAQCGRYNKPGAGRGHGRYRDIRGQDREPGIPAASRALETGREPWDDNLLEDYANDLRSLGLFNRVEAKADAGDLKTGAARGI